MDTPKAPTQIQILPYNPTWPATFQRLKSTHLPLPPPHAQIHHIGSTAVPNLPAKNIIDIQITLPALTDLNHHTLTQAGLTRRPPPTTDHMPPGLTLPPKDLAKFLYRHDAPAANIHIRQQGRFNQRSPLLCRHNLRAHPQTAAAYATIKLHLARHVPHDADACYDVNDSVFDLIMAAAEPWAAATAWHPPPSD